MCSSASPSIPSAACTSCYPGTGPARLDRSPPDPGAPSIPHGHGPRRMGTVDDAYLGGERPGGKRGRGAAGKTPIVAAVETTVERRPRRLRLSVVKGFRKKEVERLAERDFAPRGKVVSDRPSCWPAGRKGRCPHF